MRREPKTLSFAPEVKEALKHLKTITHQSESGILTFLIMRTYRNNDYFSYLPESVLPIEVRQKLRDLAITYQLTPSELMVKLIEEADIKVIPVDDERGDVI